MLNWFRLEILNPKGLESSIVYMRQCSSVIVSPDVVTFLLSEANTISSYLMVKTVLQFFSVLTLSAGTGKREPWDRGWLEAQKRKMSNPWIRLLSAQQPLIPVQK